MGRIQVFIMIKTICVCFVYERNSELIFNGLDGEITLEEYAKECYEILKHCTGHNSIEEIVEITCIDREIVTDIIDFLIEYKIVYNGTQLYKYYQEVSSNPMYFRTSLSPTQISRLSKPQINPENKPTLRNKSIRDFDKNYQHKSVEIIKFLSDALGNNQVREYPSAGGLYPIEIYVVNSKENQDFARGVYKFENKQLNNQNLAFDVGMLYKAFESRELIDNSGLVIVLVANLTSSSAKYCNRSYRYACLEAGHIAQNLYIKAKNTDLAICEYGGFSDDIITQYLALE